MTRAATARKRPARKPRKKPAVDPLAGPEKRQRCAAKTGQGKRCKRKAQPGSDRCHIHLGAAVGRPTLLNDETADRIVAIVKAGGFPETAALVAGVGRRTLYDWLARGHPEGVLKPVAEGEDPGERELRAEDQPFRDFRERLEQARKESELRHVAAITSSKDWRAHAWLLQRLNPDEFSAPRAAAGGVHPDAFAAGEASADPGADVVDDQVGADGRPL